MRRAHSQSGAAATGILLVVALAMLLGLAVYLRHASATGPMDFAAHGAAPSGYRGADPTGAPAGIADAAVLARGEYLTRAADCEACHTRPDGARFAGGRAFVLPIGTLYSTNLTPDRQTGIGNWSDAEFARALHQGIARDGRRLYPAFPYAAYTYLTDSDVVAIRAYLFSLAPVSAAAPVSQLSFPFNQRWLMGLWSWLFNPDQRFRANAAMSAQWNRGAYLAEALEHCGECHTPRNLLQALDHRRKYAGSTLEGWNAYNISADRSSGIGAWSDAELMQYLSSGHASGHGSAAGPMGEAVDQSLKYLTSGDLAALTVYLRSVPAIASTDEPTRLAGPAPAAHSQGVPGGIDPRGKAIFESACIGCHAWTGAGAVSAYATLTGARALNDPSALNVVQVLLSGARHGPDPSAPSMPSFDAAYSDAELAAVANYVLARFGSQRADISASQVAALRRQDRAGAVSVHGS